MLRDDVMNISPVRIVSTEITIKCPYFVFRLISICLMLSGVTTGVATERRQQNTVFILNEFLRKFYSDRSDLLIQMQMVSNF